MEQGSQSSVPRGKRKKRHEVMSLLLLAVLATGCTRTIYSWGHFEDSIYVSYAEPGKVSVETQVEKLEADYQKARAQQKPVPPGFHAHLGHLYSELGKADKARQEFEAEKAQFPESAVFMDHMIAGLNKQ
jgi:hypothetical protein